MLPVTELRFALDRSLCDTSDVYTGHVMDPAAYVEDAKKSLLEALCEPFWVRATVCAPAFPDHAEGEIVEGYCLAERNGYWLVYSPDELRFYCFWGTARENLGAHGVFGSALACWLA